MCVLRGLSAISLFGINTSYSRWNIFSAPGTTGAQYSLYLGEIEAQLAQTVEIEDRFLAQSRPLVNSLYKSIPADRALQLLNDGASQTSAVITSISEYLDSIAPAPSGALPQAASTRELTLNDPAGNTTTFDLTNYNNNVVTLNAGNNNDTIDLGGENNVITMSGGTGNDTINVDDSSANVFYVTGSTGTDTLNIAGDLVDYSFLDNADGTLTMTNNSTGTEVTINNSFESINFGDGSTLAYNGTTVTINSVVDQAHLIIDQDNTTYNLSTASGNEVLELTGDLNTLTVDMNAGDDNFIISGDQNNVTVDMGAGNDLLQIGGSNNTVSVQTYDKQDRIFVEAGNNNIITIDGGNYTDTVRLEGIDTDWTLAGNTYTHNTTGTSVTISNVENVLFGQLTTDAAGNATTFDLTAYLDTTEILHTGDMNDTVDLGGTNNNVDVYLDSGDNTVNIDTTNFNNFIINGGTGTDTVNFAGNIGDYTFQNNLNGTLTVIDITSGAVTTLDSNVNNINFADLSVLAFNEDSINIISSNLDDTINVTGSDNNLIINTFNGNDTINVEGTNNTVSVSMANGDDNLYVAVGDNNNITVDGADGNDTLTLQGVAGDWTLTGVNPGQTYYENIYSGTKVTLQTSIENIVFDNSVVIYDNPGLSSTLDATGYSNSTILVNAGDGDDTINLDGTNNVATVDLVSGDNIVNIDDSVASAYTVNAGTGTDTINLTGNYVDYTFSKDANDIVTLTNTVSGATITYNDAYQIETINMADASMDPITGGLIINGTPGDDVLDATIYNDKPVVVNPFEGRDVVNLAGTNNDVEVNLLSGFNTLNIDDSTQSDYIVHSGTDADLINLTGNIADYNIVDNGDGTSTITNTISGATITIDNTPEDFVVAADGLLVGDIYLEGTPLVDNMDASVYNASNILVLALDDNDTVALGGTGNTATVEAGAGDDVINVDDSASNDFRIYGDVGNDVVNMTGNLGDYTFTDNLDGNYTLTNTISGATTTVNLDVEAVNMADGTTLTYDGTTLTITDAPGNANTIDTSSYDTLTLVINAGDQNDTLTLGGTNTDITANLDSGDNIVNVDGSTANTYVVNGGTGNDTLNLTGNLSDYDLQDNGDGTLTLTNSVSGATLTVDAAVEDIYLADGSLINFDGTTITVTDAPGNANTFDTSAYNNVTYIINAGDQNDTLILGGTNTDITANLNSGTNTVTVDDSVANTYAINGGTGIDTVNLSGTITNYSFQDNGDGTLTITNSVSGATTTIDSAIENINLADGVSLDYDGSNLTITDAIGHAANINSSSYSDLTLVINAGNLNDSITLGGTNNDITANLNSGNNFVTVDGSVANTYVLYGGTGTDTVNLSGNLSDYDIQDNGDGTLTMTNTVSGATMTIDGALENINLADGSRVNFDGSTITITDAPGHSATFDTSTYNNVTYVFNAGDQNDNLILGGTNTDITANLNSGTNTVTVDDTVANTYAVNGGTGTDTVNLTGDLTDYTFLDNGDGTLTMTNTGSGATLTVGGTVENINLADGSVLGYDGTTLTVTDAAGSSSTIDFSAYSNMTLVINAGDQNDTIDLGGTANDVTVNLNSGTNTVNIDDTTASDYTIYGGTGTDSVYLTGVKADYSLLDNGDGTITLTNTVSNATITLDPMNLENVYATDGLIDINYVTIDGTTGPDALDASAYNNFNITINALAGNDTVTVGGNNNTVTANLDGGDDVVNYDDSQINDLTVFGGLGNDTVNLTGNLSDYSIQDNGDSTLTLTNTTSGATLTIDAAVENVSLADGSLINYNGSAITITDAPGSSSTIDLSSNSNMTMIINAGDQNDTIDLGGTSNNTTVNLNSGTNTVNIDDSTASDYTINGGTGTDSVYLTGAKADYSVFDNGDGTFTLTNTVSNATITYDPTIVESVYATDGLIKVNIVTINGTAGPDVLDASIYDDYDITVNALAGNDTVTVGGNNNAVTANLDDGDDVVNYDDSQLNDLTVFGGLGNDTVNMTGNLSDYTIQDNGDSTLTFTNTTSGATMTIDAGVENVSLGDGSLINYNGSAITITDAPGNASTFDTSAYNNVTYTINAGDQNDTLILGGTNNDITANLDSGNNSVTVDDSVANTFVINGGTGTDTLDMTGSLPDYAFTDNGDGTLTITNSISGATTTIDNAIENINLADGTVLSYDGTTLTINDALGNSNTINSSAYSDLTLVINVNNMDDTVNLGGSNNTITTNLDSGINIVNVDDSNANTFVVNGGTGADTVNMAGNFADYTLTDNLDGTLTFTNTTSGATTTIDAAIETVNFADAYAITYDGANITLTGFTTGADTITISGTNTTFTAMDSGNGADVITIDGTNNTVNISTGLQNDSIFVMAGSNNTITLDGSSQTDTLTLEGSSGDWNLVGSTYTHNVTGTSVTISNIENVNFTI